jgi:hypothetical protein
VGGVADAQRARPEPAPQPVDPDPQRPHVVPAAQLTDPVGQERHQLGDRGEEALQPLLADLAKHQAQTTSLNSSWPGYYRWTIEAQNKRSVQSSGYR